MKFVNNRNTSTFREMKTPGIGKCISNFVCSIKTNLQKIEKEIPRYFDKKNVVVNLPINRFELLIN